MLHYVQVSQIAANCGITLGALAAVFTAVVVSLKTLESQWNENFRSLYKSFWTDQLVSQARRIIAYDQEYEKVRHILVLVVLNDRLAKGEYRSKNGVLIRSYPSCPICQTIGKKVPKDNLKVTVSSEEMDLMETIDRFCSMCLQVSFISSHWVFGKRRRRFQDIFLSYWIEQIKRRPELRAYLQEEWPTFPMD